MTMERCFGSLPFIVREESRRLSHIHGQKIIQRIYESRGLVGSVAATPAGVVL
jgi:hypothetical protein